jgi:hypothetical protein
MITIKGTSKIKGALDLSGINKQLKTGDSVPLSEDDFLDQTVQVAVSMGYLTYEKGGMLDMEYNATSIKIRNIYDRPVRIQALDDEIRPGQTFTLTEDQVNSGDIRSALAKGLLEIVSSARSTKSNESDVRVGDLFDDKSEENVETEETSRYLETNEEALDPSVIDNPEPKPVEKSDIPDPKGKTVVWNPTRTPVAHAKTQMEAVSLGKEGTQEVIESNVDISDISFVDAELDQKRKDSHPILKDKPKAKEDGIDFL